MRTVFAICSLIIVSGTVLFTVVGLTHQ